jgi:hypothetical protein
MTSNLLMTMALPGALTFSDPVLLIGLLAAGIPILLHLLNRVRSPVVPFSTLRFLRTTAQKTARKRQIQQFLLLLMRMAVFALIAMAIAGPLVHGGTPELAYGMILLLLIGLVASAAAVAALVNYLERPKHAGGAGGSSKSSVAPTPTPRPVAVPPGRWAAIIAVLIAGLGALGISAFGLTTNSLFPDSAVHFDGSNAAVVIILDNSQSMLAQVGGRTRLSRAAHLARELILRTLHPAREAVLLTNPGTEPVPEALSANLIASAGRLQHLQSLGRARPMAELVAKAARLLTASRMPEKVLVIISDFAGPAASETNMFAALKKLPAVQLVLMPMAEGAAPDDVAIEQFRVLRGQAVAGSHITLEARVVNNGSTAVVPSLSLLLNGQPLPTSAARVSLGPAGTSQSVRHVRLHCVLSQPGWQLIQANINNPSGVLPWADHRRLILKAAAKIRALVVGNSVPPAPGAAAFYVDAALAPYSGSISSANQPWSIIPRTVDIQSLSSIHLERYGAVFLCDVPQVTPAETRRLAEFVKDGGRLCWLLGPGIDPHFYNTVLLPHGLLPGSMTRLISSIRGEKVSTVDTRSYLCGHLFTDESPFQRIVVANMWGIASMDQSAGVLMSVSSGRVLLTDQALGKGRIYTFTSSPAGGWSNIGATSVFLPLMVRIALGNAATAARNAAYEPGDRIDLPVPQRIAPMSVNVTLPKLATVINIKPDAKGTHRPRWIFDQTDRTGIYHWTSFDGKTSGMFVVNPPGSEANLHPTPAAVLAKMVKLKHPVLIASTAQKLLAVIKKTNAGSSLMPGILALVALLAVFEALVSNRNSPAGTAPGAPRGTGQGRFSGAGQSSEAVQVVGSGVRSDA